MDSVYQPWAEMLRQMAGEGSTVEGQSLGRSWKPVADQIKGCVSLIDENKFRLDMTLPQENWNLPAVCGSVILSLKSFLMITGEAFL